MSSKPLINLFRGWPNPSLHPLSALQSASSSVLSDPSISSPALSYGPDEGYEPLRAEIAAWLTSFYFRSYYREEVPRPISPSRICITGGASQNLACILQVFTDPVYTRNVWMVAPTYYLACRIFEDAGFGGKLRAVPEDRDGVDVKYLEREIEKSEERAAREGNLSPTLKPARPWRKIYKHIIYATPTFSNPSSKVMSLDRRISLVRLARAYDALIITDDVYDHLHWAPNESSFPITSEIPLGTAVVLRVVDVDKFIDGGPPKDGFGNAVSNGSFSKLIAPGCRVGWAEGTEKFAYGLSQAGSSRSGGAPSQYTSTLISQLLSTGFLQTHISSTLLPTYLRRYDILYAAVRIHLVPLGVTISELCLDTRTAGGYFLWIKLPPGLSAKELAKKAEEEENLLIAPGGLFQVSGDESGNEEGGFDGYVRLCFTWEEEENLGRGVERFAGLIRRELGKGS